MLLTQRLISSTESLTTLVNIHRILDNSLTDLDFADDIAISMDYNKP